MKFNHCYPPAKIILANSW